MISSFSLVVIWPFNFLSFSDSVPMLMDKLLGLFAFFLRNGSLGLSS